MGGIITEAARQDAWRLAVSSAREGNLVAFAEKGVAVLNRELAGADPENSLLWDEIISTATCAKIVKFRAHGIIVLVW